MKLGVNANPFCLVTKRSRSSEIELSIWHIEDHVLMVVADVEVVAAAVVSPVTEFPVEV